jgi:hypothetical protein
LSLEERKNPRTETNEQTISSNLSMKQAIGTL